MGTALQLAVEPARFFEFETGGGGRTLGSPISAMNAMPRRAGWSRCASSRHSSSAEKRGPFASSDDRVEAGTVLDDGEYYALNFTTAIAPGRATQGNVAFDHCHTSAIVLSPYCNKGQVRILRHDYGRVR